MAASTLPQVFCALTLLVVYVSAEFYTNLFAVHIEGGERKARSVAEKHGLHYEGEVSAVVDSILFTDCLTRQT